MEEIIQAKTAKPTVNETAIRRDEGPVYERLFKLSKEAAKRMQKEKETKELAEKPGSPPG
jgi:hypothetical protein